MHELMKLIQDFIKTVSKVDETVKYRQNPKYGGKFSKEIEKQ